MTKSTSQNNFKTQLKQYFPEIYAFWELFKWDYHYSQLIDAILEMTKQSATGTIKIVYQRGKINYITQEKHLTAYKKNTKL